MPDNNPETNSLLVRIGIYAAGTILGVGAKLAMLNNENKLTMKTIIFHSVVAFATAWIVWWMLEGKLNENILVAVSVVVGRFGDVILISFGKGIIKFIQQSINKDL